MKFNIGDMVWRAAFESTVNHVVCPDCLGDGRIRVIMGDETEVSVDCERCKRGWDRSTGRIEVHDRVGMAVRCTITGVAIRAHEDSQRIEYTVSPCYCIDEDRLFDNEEEALQKAKLFAAQFDAEERLKIERKERPVKSWAANASHHRREIERLERQLAYHRAKLAVASLRAKEDKMAKKGS